jgi:hypothetical protein
MTPEAGSALVLRLDGTGSDDLQIPILIWHIDNEDLFCIQGRAFDEKSWPSTYEKEPWFKQANIRP